MYNPNYGASSTSETVRVVRPLKIISLICGGIAVLLMIISSATTFWLEASNYRQGLWQECYWEKGTETQCRSNGNVAWIQACAALCTIGMLVVIGGCVLNLLGLLSGDVSRKTLLYRIATGCMFFAVLCIVIALIVFPVKFMEEIKKRSDKIGNREWYFGWAYGLTWGAVIFIVGAAVLLIIDKEEEEIYSKQQTYYYGSPA